MVTFIQRDFSRPEQDDFLLNVKPELEKGNEAIPVQWECELLGWKIIPCYA